jgi:hypothetical protein
MDVDLHQRLLADAAKAVNLARLDHQNVAGARLEFLPVDRYSPRPDRMNCTSS